MAAGDLVALADVREHLQVQTADTEQDPITQSLITRASQTISRHCDREFAPTTDAATRRVRVRPDRHLDGFYLVDLAPYDLRAATAVKLHPETSSPQTLTLDYDYMLEPYEKSLGVWDRLKLHGTLPIVSSTVAQRFGFAYLGITGDWGFPAVPAQVKEACILTVIAQLRSDVQAFGSALQPNSFGAGVNDAIALTPGVRGLLSGFVRQVAF